MSKINKLATELLLEVKAFAQLSPSHEANHAISVASNLVGATENLPVNADAVLAANPPATDETPKAKDAETYPSTPTEAIDKLVADAVDGAEGIEG